MNLDLTLISIIEGVTEFLPISSTAHLILAGKLLTLNLADDYTKFYLLAIQFGALLSGVFFFGKKVLTDRKLIINIFVSFLPSAVVGFALYKIFKELLEGNFVLLSLTLLLGGIIFIYLEKSFIKKSNPENAGVFGKDDITLTDAFVVGLAQSTAIIPGVSRSGATITAGILRGIKKAVIIEYTFILALPTLGSAVLYDAYKSREIFTSMDSFDGLFSGTLIAFAGGLLTLYFLQKYLTKISLTYFGIYRIILSIFILFIFVI